MSQRLHVDILFNSFESGMKKMIIYKQKRKIKCQKSVDYVKISLVLERKPVHIVKKGCKFTYSKVK